MGMSGVGNLLAAVDGHEEAADAVVVEDGLCLFVIEVDTVANDLLGVVGAARDGGTFVDAAQTHVVVLDLRQREHTHDDKRGLAVLDLQDRISHHVRSGVDAEDEFGFRHFSYCSKSSTPRMEGSKTRESSSIVCSY